MTVKKARYETIYLLSEQIVGARHCGRYWNYKVNKSSAVPSAEQLPVHFILCVTKASRLFRDQLFVISEKIFLFTISKVAFSLSHCLNPLFSVSFIFFVCVY